MCIDLPGYVLSVVVFSRAFGEKDTSTSRILCLTLVIRFEKFYYPTDLIIEEKYLPLAQYRTACIACLTSPNTGKLRQSPRERFYLASEVDCKAI